MSVYYADATVTLHHGQALDVLGALDAGSVQCAVTSPPYFGLRDYGVDGQIGLEATPAAYVEALRAVFDAARRVLAADGVLWLNLGDTYSGSWGNQSRTETSPGLAPAADGRYPAMQRTGAIRPGQPPAKNLLGMPWRVAFALQDDGWTLRNAVIWSKPNAMPESVTDRLSSRYEHVFLLSRSRRYWFDLDPIREPLLYPDAADGSRTFGGVNKSAELTTGSSARRTGNVYGKARPWANSQQSDDHDAADPRGRNPGDVWTIATSPFPGAHFATMPPALAKRCILAGSREGDTVLDPFVGSGTTCWAARQAGRKSVGIDLRADYLDIAVGRIGQDVLDFGGVA